MILTVHDLSTIECPYLGKVAIEFATLRLSLLAR